MDYTKYTLVEVQHMLRTGKVSSVELVSQCIQNIEKNKDINAVLSYNKEYSLNQAKKADELLKQNCKGDLLGSPVIVKDNICTTEFKTTCASKFLENYVSPFDAFAVKKLKPTLEKLTPQHILNGLKKTLNPFAPKNLMELAKAIAKMAVVVAYCGFAAVFARKEELFGLLGADITTGFAVLGSVLTQMIINICIAMLIIGFIDKKYQDYEYNKSLKMTKQEVKDEWKNTEGDPLIKAKIKAAQRQFAQQKMMSAIPQSDVVVVNPTHYAVAIKYDKSEAPAPKVVAKGIDFMAFKIREIAKHNNVPIVENPPLARALYKLVKIDAMIPAELYVTVAEILAFVYNKNKSGV